MTIHVQYVEPELAAQSWHLVEKYIEAALVHGHGDYTLDQVKLLVNMGQWLLLVAVDESGSVHGAATVSFLNYPNSRVAFITSIGGRLISSPDTFKEMTIILKSRGATRVQGLARPSVARLWKRYGFEEISAMVEVKI